MKFFDKLEKLLSEYWGDDIFKVKVYECIGEKNTRINMSIYYRDEITHWNPRRIETFIVKESIILEFEPELVLEDSRLPLYSIHPNKSKYEIIELDAGEKRFKLDNYASWWKEPQMIKENRGYVKEDIKMKHLNLIVEIDEEINRLFKIGNKHMIKET